MEVGWTLTCGTKDQSLAPEIVFIVTAVYLCVWYLLVLAGADDIHQGGGDVLQTGAAGHQA